MIRNKTNAMRMLDTEGIVYDIQTYEIDENDLSGEHVVRQLNQSPDQVFKTLVLKDDKKNYFVCCISVRGELDLKKAAKAFQVKKLEMLPLKELLEVTGYVRGGCSPIGMKKRFPTCFDETAILFDEIILSAGVRGMQILVSPEALCTYLDANYVDLMKSMK